LIGQGCRILIPYQDEGEKSAKRKPQHSRPNKYSRHKALRRHQMTEPIFFLTNLCKSRLVRVKDIIKLKEVN